MATNLIIRGHIRNAFGNRDLYDLVREISDRADISVFIHTWSVFQTSASWRRMPDDHNPVDEDQVRSYFSDLSPLIKKVMVDDEKKVELSGRLHGTIGHTPCPVAGYKYMFYGMLRAAEYVASVKPPEDLVVQTRFDVMSNWRRFSRGQIVDFVFRKPSKRIQFIVEEAYNESTVGIDNIYMANAKDMYEFIRHMYLNLDEVDEANKASRHMGHQEWLTMFEAMKFNAG